MRQRGSTKTRSRHRRHVDTSPAVCRLAGAVERLLTRVAEEQPQGLDLELWIGADIAAVRAAARGLQDDNLPAAADEGLLDIKIIVEPAC